MRFIHLERNGSGIGLFLDILTVSHTVTLGPNGFVCNAKETVQIKKLMDPVFTIVENINLSLINDTIVRIL